MPENQSENFIKRITSIRLPNWVNSVWLSLLALYILAGVPLVPLHGDETTQIYMARDFYALFVERDPSQLTYQAWDSLDGQAATQQDLRLKDGTLHRYIFGAAAYLGGYAKIDMNDQWEWGSGWDWNHANGHVPPDDLLFRVRYASALMLALGLSAIFWIAYYCGGRLSAYIVTLFYALSPALLLNGRRAMMEGAMTLFTLAVVLAGIWALLSRKLWAFVALGIFSGLAVASKHTSVVTVAAIFFACLLVFIYRAWQTKSIRESIIQIAYLFIAGIFSLVIFYALNPAWWSNPLERAAEVSDIRLNFMQSQQGAFGGYASLTERLQGFFRQTFVLENMYAETDIDNFRENLSDAIEQYENSFFSGLIIKDAPILGLIFAGLAISGIFALWRNTAYSAEARFVVSVWMAAILMLTLFLTPLEWQRYYLPMYPAVLLLAGFGFTAPIQFALHRNH